MHTGNELGPHANEVCEPEGTDTHFTKTMCKAQTADESNALHKQLSTALGKRIAHQLESIQPLI